MNNRIQELANKTGLGHMFHLNEHASPGMCRPGDIEKFAELIIEECRTLIQMQVSLKYKNGGEEGDDYIAGYYAGSRDARSVIKHYFETE
jgi:hypothetical protein